jgi:hypothetical protein
MPVIKHGDREIHYEHYDLIPHIKIFHQDFSPFGAGSDYEVIASLGGQALIDFESQGDDHISRDFVYKAFNESPPIQIPSYDYIIYKGTEKKFPYMDAMSVGGIIGPNQLIISYRLMGLLQQYRMAPHITAPVVVKHRDNFIEDYYVMVYFWQHGCDLVDWENTVFEMIEPIKETHLSTFSINSFNEYKEFRKRVSKEGIHYRPLSLVFVDRYDIFYCNIGKIFISSSLQNGLKSKQFKNVWISGGGYFETRLTTKYDYGVGKFKDLK